MACGEPFARGNTADLYRDGHTVIKVFHTRFFRDEAPYEAGKQELARALGLNAPRVLQVTQVEGRPAIEMDYVEGGNLGDALLAHPERRDELLAMAAGLQARMHLLPGAGLEDLPARLTKKISEAATLPAGLRQRLAALATSLPAGDRLLHGDFHPFNLIDSGAGIFILDWGDAGCGNPCADAARSWLLLAGHSVDMADGYLRAYCAAAGRPLADILAWLPAVAGARLSENLSPALQALCLRLAKNAPL